MTNNSQNSANAGTLLGKGFLTLAWVSVLILGMFFFRQSNPVISTNDTVNGPFSIAANSQGHYLINGAINGRPVLFLVDTGATDVAIPAKFADKLGLDSLARGYASTANGTTQISLTRIANLTIGPFEFRDIRASINPGLDHSGHVLLGMSALKHIEMQQKNRILTLSLSKEDV